MTIFVEDSFTEASNVNLTSHTGETGATWSNIYGLTTLAVAASTDSAYGLNDTNTRGNYASGVPATAEYYVQADFVNFESSNKMGICGRVDPSSQTFYHARGAGTGDIELYKAISGTYTLLGSASLGAGDYTIKLELLDATKKVFSGSTEVISSADNTITDKGRAGLRCFSVSSYYPRIDNFMAEDIGAAAAKLLAIVMKESNQFNGGII